MNEPIQFPTQEQSDAALADFTRQLREQRAFMHAAIAEARPALDRLAAAMRHKTGQGFKLRGQPASLLEIVNLDHALRVDFCKVLVCFGYNDREMEFFYDAISEAMGRAGLQEWFEEEFAGSEVPS